MADQSSVDSFPIIWVLNIAVGSYLMLQSYIYVGVDKSELPQIVRGVMFIENVENTTWACLMFMHKIANDITVQLWYSSKSLQLTENLLPFLPKWETLADLLQKMVIEIPRRLPYDNNRWNFGKLSSNTCSYYI